MIVRRCPAIDLAEKNIGGLIGNSLLGSTEFGLLWKAVGGTHLYWLVESDNRILAVLPGVEFGIKSFRRFQSMTDGCYGRLFLDSSVSDDPREICDAILNGIIDAGYAKAFIYDFDGWSPLHPKYHRQECVTRVVDITSSDWQPPDKKIQSEIRKAEREGISVTEFQSDRHLVTFLELMALTEKRHHRKPKYPRPFYEKLATLTQQDDRVQWLWCEYNGKAAASHINLVENDMVINWQVFFDKQFSFLKPNQFMLYHAARHHAGRGVRLLNLGASPEDTETLDAYKKKWGGLEHRYNCNIYSSAIGRLI